MKKVAYSFRQQRPQFYNAFDWMRTSPVIYGNVDLSLEEDFLMTTCLDEVFPGRNLTHFAELEKDSEYDFEGSNMNFSPEDLWI